LHAPRHRFLWIVLFLLQASLTVFLIADRRSAVPPALGLFFGELILGLGVWLAARKLFADPRTAFFVSTAALGSFLWGRSMDAGLYVGGLTLGFAVLGLIRLERRTAGILAVVLLALVPLFAPLAKLLLAFLAGAGFEAALRKDASPKATSWTAAALLVLAIALVATSIRVSPSPTHCESLDTAALWALVAAGLLYLLRSRPRAMPLALALILFLHPLDLFGWKFRMTWIRTSPEVHAR